MAKLSKLQTATLPDAVLDRRQAVPALIENPSDFLMVAGLAGTAWELSALTHESHSLFGLGGDKSLDTIQDNRTTLDFTSAYHVNQHWTVYFNAKNLLNTPLRYYEGQSNRPIQREFYEATYEAGVRAHF